MSKITYPNKSQCVDLLNPQPYEVFTPSDANMVKEVVNRLDDLILLGQSGSYLGTAVPTTNPGTPTAKVFYTAVQAGTYTNFGGAVVSAGSFAIFAWSGSAWISSQTAVNGLDQVNNTSDANKPVSTAQAAALALKVDKTALFDTIFSPSQNLFNKATVNNGYYSENGTTFVADSYYWTSDFIAVTPGQSYKRIQNDLGAYWYWYKADKTPFTPAYNSDNSVNTKTIPTGVYFVRIIVHPADLDTIMFTLSSVDTSVYLPFNSTVSTQKIKAQYLPEATSGSVVSSLNQIGNFDVGPLDYQEIDSTDYSHIILYGQSLSQGYEAPRALTTVAEAGNFMVGSAPYYYGENLSATALNPLIAVKNNINVGEQPIVALTNAFGKLYRRFVNKSQLFIGSNPSEDGKSIERLSKECTNQVVQANNLYNQRFQKLLTDTKSIINGLGKTVSCPVILYMQGEYNYDNLPGNGLTTGADATSDKAAYKALLMTLKNNMQADVMTTYGQTKKPLFFIYEVAGSYINRMDMSINMAQIEFANENDDVFLLNPTYFTPDYNGGHLSTNGYRWYGEMMAKSLYNVFIQGKAFSPIYPESFQISGNVINIDFRVPVLPLKFDSKLTALVGNYGFNVIDDGVAVTITSVAISNNRVIITCPATLAGNIEIVYAGLNRSGAGNLRDSDSYLSMYKYFNDSADAKKETYTPQDESGAAIYGKNYPMHNWCSNFYKLITV